MDGITRNTREFDSDLSGTLLVVLGTVITLLCTLLVVAIAIEVLRRAGVATRVVRRLDSFVPKPARRLAAGLLSLSISMLGPAPVFATEAPVRDWLEGTAPTAPPTTTTTSPVATEDSLIQRATPPASVPSQDPLVATPADALPMPVDQTVVVEDDCLWAIAARRLAPSADNRAIDAAWRAIYALNRDAIGDDPNLIFPGLLLALPPIDQPLQAAP